MLHQLQKDLCTADEKLRVIILTHTGPVFSAGHDLKELVSQAFVVLIYIYFLIYLSIFQ